MDVSFTGGQGSLRTVTEESFESEGKIEIPDDPGLGVGEDDPFAWLARSFEVMLPEGREEEKREIEEDEEASPGKDRRGLKPYDDFGLVRVEFAEPQIDLLQGARQSLFWLHEKI